MSFAHLSEISETIKNGHRRIHIDGLLGSSRAFLLSKLAECHRTRAIVVILATADHAEEFLGDCQFFFDPKDLRRLVLFPEANVLPYTQLKPEPVAWADRIEILYRLLHHEPLIVITSAAASLRRLPPQHFVSQSIITLRRGEMIDREELVQTLINLGYEESSLVEDEGSFARRGGIVDVWPPTSPDPLRLELDDTHISSLRTFNPATQCSIVKASHDTLVLIPVRDFSFSPEARKAATEQARRFAEDADMPTGERRSLFEQLREGIAFGGIDTFLPAFHPSTAILADYAGDALFIADDPHTIETVTQKLTVQLRELHRVTTGPEKIIPPHLLYLSLAEWEKEINNRQCMIWNGLRRPKVSGETSATTLLPDIRSNSEIRALVQGHAKGEDMLSPLITRFHADLMRGQQIVLSCHTEIQAERLSSLFRSLGLAIVPFDTPFAELTKLSDRAIRLRVGRISAGFRWESEHVNIITDEEIFGTRHARRPSTKSPPLVFTSLAELAPDDLLVHQNHGIGRYVGLEHMTIGDEPGDYLILEYLGGDKLYLPVYRINLIQRYIGPGSGAPPLDRLGGTRWSSVQKKARQEIRTIARELLKVAAARKVHAGFPFPPTDTAFDEFCATFPYDETPDQQNAIDDTMRDMKDETPMDRLICGDVGYGKTEVAMRAAFRAAIAGKQVVILVPTTVLALQHYETCTARFQGTPIVVEMLSRFRTASEQRAILRGLKRGNIDIVIGTHRLLQSDITLRDLGLLIIDEEHRFGVTHKERIKKLKTTVDCLTLTATPIPRTLNLALTGLRDMSIINTPPANRQSIATHVVPFDEGVIRLAITQELERGGQVFFVHNRVETINSMFERLSAIVPSARISVGHGQMAERDLERVMVDFLHHKSDVLLCTTIIESGLDISTANTIIINRADTFGLAQLYQLRGRVGRSNVHAEAYLLIPTDGTISPIAKRRLHTLTRFTELGSGFQIAMHDLEIRGAGNILGSAQHGHIAEIGYELYARLLARTIRGLQGKEDAEELDPELHLRVEAFLPESYVADDGTRISLYQRLANRETVEEIVAMGQEFADRFGPLPREAENLLRVMEIKIMARTLRIRSITCDGKTFSCLLDHTTPIDPGRLMELIPNSSLKIRFHPPDRLLASPQGSDAMQDTLTAAKNLLSRLAGCVTDAPHST